MKKLTKKVLRNRGIPYKILLFFIKLLLKVFLKTNKIIIKDDNNLLKQEKFFLLFWHNRSIMAPYFFPKKVTENSFAIASESRDGQIVADYLQSWKIEMVRGSYGKKSAIHATKKIIQKANKLSIGMGAIGIDGPTGPKYECKNGLIRLLSHLKIPIYIMSINYSKSWQLKTWDNLQLPKPFGTITFIIKKPFDDNFQITKENLLETKELLTKKMMEITKD